jgi:hypothetical protein
MEQELKKKKKRKNGLMINFNSLTDEEIFLELSEIRKRLKTIFKRHIGEENSITPQQLFKDIFYIDPEYVDVFKREYWWNILRGIIRQLRSEETLFIINKRTKLFVLSNEKECNDFKKILDRDIENMKQTKIKADNWVKNKKYLNL